MKKNNIIFFLMVLQSFTGLLYGQNLVPNPGFEELKVAPSCWTLGSKADFDSRIQDWILPTEGTTDILSTLAPLDCITALPTNTYPPVDWFPKVNQQPRSGMNVLGIKPFFETRREYIEVKLDCDMIAGKEYYCEMYVSLAEGTNYAQNKLGIYFSDTLVYVNSTEMLSFTPQVVENNVIDDTVNWVKISGTFTASSAHRYMIIGCFATAAQMQAPYIGPKSEVDFPYYLIDDVLVKPVEPPSLTLLGDTTICKGEKLDLFVNGWNNIIWTHSSTQIGQGSNLLYTPANSMILKIKGNRCNWPLEREVEITVLPLPQIKLGNDTLICQGTSLLLDAGAGYPSYSWQDGSTSQTYLVTVKGKYAVALTSANGCENKDEIQIGFYKNPQIDLGSDQVTCTPRGRLNANTGQTNDTYLWQDGSSSTEFEFQKEGLYTVTVTNVCGVSDVDSITIKEIKMVIPNLITPNGDNKNDSFEILGTELGEGNLSIYNRYGAAVYNDTGYKNNWAGDHLSDGVYFFQFQYPTCLPVKGWLEIMR